MSCDPKTLLQAAKCLCMDERQLKLVSVSLTCTWAAAGGGGGGAATTRITEDGQIRITEAGVTRVIE